MKKNIGSKDKYARILVAIVIALLVYFKVIEGIVGYVLIAVAAIFVFTSLINFCPIYDMLGLNSCKVHKRE